MIEILIIILIIVVVYKIAAALLPWVVGLIVVGAIIRFLGEVLPVICTWIMYIVGGIAALYAIIVAYEAVTAKGKNEGPAEECLCCAKCGKENIENSRVCAACGSDMEVAAISPSISAQNAVSKQGQSIWDKYCSWQGRISRKRFWVMSLYIVGLGIVNLIILEAEMIGISTIVSLITLVLSLSIAVRGAHNYGKSAVWAIVPPLSMYVLYLLIFKNGMADANQYGEPPIN